MLPYLPNEIIEKIIEFSLEEMFHRQYSRTISKGPSSYKKHFEGLARTFHPQFSELLQKLLKQHLDSSDDRWRYTEVKSWIFEYIAEKSGSEDLGIEREPMQQYRRAVAVHYKLLKTTVWFGKLTRASYHGG